MKFLLLTMLAFSAIQALDLNPSLLKEGKVVLGSVEGSTKGFNVEVDKDGSKFISINGSIKFKNNDLVDMCTIVNEKNDLLCSTYRMKSLYLPAKSNHIIVKGNELSFGAKYLAFIEIDFKKIMPQ